MNCHNVKGNCVIGNEGGKHGWEITGLLQTVPPTSIQFGACASLLNNLRSILFWIRSMLCLTNPAFIDWTDLVNSTQRQHLLLCFANQMSFFYKFGLTFAHPKTVLFIASWKLVVHVNAFILKLPTSCFAGLCVVSHSWHFYHCNGPY